MNERSNCKRNWLIVIATTDDFFPTTVEKNRLKEMISLISFEWVLLGRGLLLHVQIVLCMNLSHRRVEHKTRQCRYPSDGSSKHIGLGPQYCAMTVLDHLPLDDNSLPQGARDIDDRTPMFQS